MIGGKIIHGKGKGKKLGFPTANLDCGLKKIKLKSGVYAAKAILDGKTYKSGLIIQNKPIKMEVFLLDYKGPDFYGSFLEVIPIQKVAELEKYESKKELRDKIKGDLNIIESMLS